MRRNFAMAVLMMILFAACAGPGKKDQLTVFFPAAPDAPRFQYLTSFNGQKEIVPERSGFDKFIVGKDKDLKRLDKPYGVAIYQGKIYVCDVNRGLMVFDMDKKTFAPYVGSQGQGKLVQPINISIDKEGNKYIADTARGQVVIFSGADTFVNAFGLPGTWKPTDVIRLDDRLYVADMKNFAVVVLDRTTGELIKKIGSTGPAIERIGRPTNIAFDKDGTLYVSDGERFQVLKYDRDGHYIGMLGRLDDRPGGFTRPKGMAIDREKRLYVVDSAFDHVQIFNAEGNTLMSLGYSGRGVEPGSMYVPVKVAIDYDNLQYFQEYIDPKFEAEYLVLVTSQFGEKMLSVFAFGKEKGRKYQSDEELMAQLKKELEKRKAELKPERPEEKGTQGEKE